MFPEAHSAVLLRGKIRLWMFINDKTFQCSSLGKRREEGRVRKRSKSEHGRREEGKEEEGIKRDRERQTGGGPCVHMCE